MSRFTTVQTFVTNSINTALNSINTAFFALALLVSMLAFVSSNADANQGKDVLGPTGIQLHRSMSVDRNCDGSFADETTFDSTFETHKEVAPGSCVIVRVSFENVDERSFYDLVVRDSAHALTPYRGGSARLVAQPTGMTLYKSKLPKENQAGELVWHFAGEIKPGEKGVVQFSIRVAG